MSPLSRSVAACAIASFCACSGARDDQLDNLDTARKDAGSDAASEAGPDDGPQADAGGEPDAGELDAGEPSQDAASMDATTLAPLDGAVEDARADAVSSSDGAASSETGTGPEGGIDASSPSDASGDAGAVDSGTAAYLRVTVTRGGVPVEEALVFFSGVEEMLVGSARTDQNGRAEPTQTVSVVTVLMPLAETNVRAHLFSFFHVKQGDDLKLELPFAPGERQDSYVLTAPVEAPGIERYDATGGLNGCARGSVVPPDTTLYVGHQVGCRSPTNNALLVSSWRTVSGSSGTYYIPAAYGLVSGLAAPTQIPTSVAWPALSAIRDVHLDVNGVPSNTTVDTELWSLLGTQALPLGVKQSDSFLSVSDSIEYAAPSFSFDAFRSHGSFHAGQLRHRIRARSADSQTASSLEIGNALPDIVDFTMDENVLNGPRFYWNTEAAPARDAFVFEGQLNVRNLPNEGDARILWTGVCAPNATGVRLPPVPPAVLPQVPAGSSWFITRMSEVRSSLEPDYDAFRQEPLYFLPGGSDLVELPLPAQGETEVATWDHRS